MEEEKRKNKIVEKEITEEMKSAYIDYAMSVIVSRAIPDVRDGLKPVQRRILYTMYEMGLRPERNFRKCAGVVGECMAKYHPHGDAPIYEALVRLAQDFTLRYPLVLGQGNFGSIDGDPPAAQRYTECKLSKIGQEMLKDIEKETVDFVPNYDGTKKEPVVLPSPLPQLLLNGSLGIAVGMATNIPPHNLKEVCEALIYLIDHPKAQVKDLFKFIQGPDFPTGGFIFDREEIIRAYSQGRGPIVCRAKAQIVEGEGKRKKILITEIPYQVSKSQILEEMAKLVLERKIEGIKSIRDESDREGLRITVELKREVDAKRILNLLYKYTQLQKTFHLNMVALSKDLEPRVFNLIDLLKAFLDHRKEIIIRRTKYDLKRAKERAHILEGLKKCLGKIEKVVKIIKLSETREKAKKRLMKNFRLDKVQAEAILETKLATLSRMERKKIEEELKMKEKEIKKLEKILKSPKLVKEEMKKEFEELKQKYGDERKTKVIKEKVTEIKEEELIPPEETLILLTKKGYIKRMSPKEYRTQKRGGKGVLGIKSKEDTIEHFILANTRDNLLVFVESGKVFSLPVYEIPKEKRERKGKSIFTLLEIKEGERILSLAPLKKEKKYLIFLTKNGKIKKTEISKFENIRRSGILAIKLKKGDILKSVKLAQPESKIFIFTKKGQGILFPIKEIREMGRQAEGIRGIKLKKGDEAQGLEILPKEIKNLYLLTITENGFGKRTSLKEFRVQKRGGKGIKIAKINEKTGNLVLAKTIQKEKELILVSEKGKVLKTKISCVPKLSRVTRGVKLMQLKEDKIVCANLI